MNNTIAVALAVARKDLRAEWRTRELVPALAQFVVLALVIANFGFQIDARNAPTIAPGMRERHDLSVDELIDLEQQADFYIALGQEDAAIDLLMGHVRSSGGASPMPYLKLLAIYRGRSDGDAYDASFWTIPCNEGPWTGNRNSVIRQSQKLIDKDLPLLGAGWLIQPCIFWENQPVALPVNAGITHRTFGVVPDCEFPGHRQPKRLLD